MLAVKLAEKYRYENCAVMALGDGGVLVGAQIAMELHCVITLLESAQISLPREPMPVAGITAGGVVAYNHSYTDGELEELVGENYGFIEAEKLSRMHELNQLLSEGGTVHKNLLKDRSVIIVSDGLQTGFELDLATQFLKPIATTKLIVATPFASVPAVDRMHVLADDLYCLDVLTDYIDTNHYYDNNDVPDHETIIHTVENIVLNWK